MKFTKNLQSLTALTAIALAGLLMAGCSEDEKVEDAIFCATVFKGGKPVTGSVTFNLDYLADGKTRPTTPLTMEMNPDGTKCRNVYFTGSNSWLMNNDDANAGDFDIVSTYADISSSGSSGSGGWTVINGTDGSDADSDAGVSDTSSGDDGILLGTISTERHGTTLRINGIYSDKVKPTDDPAELTLRMKLNVNKAKSYLFGSGRKSQSTDRSVRPLDSAVSEAPAKPAAKSGRAS